MGFPRLPVSEQIFTLPSNGRVEWALASPHPYRTHDKGNALLLGGVGRAPSLPPCPPWLNAWAGTDPERSGGGVRLRLNRVTY
jgi:hypothetical protein